MLETILNWAKPSPSQQQQPPQSQHPDQQQQQEPPTDPVKEWTPITPDTKYKLLLGGLGFLAFSLSATRRAINKRTLSARPPFYTSSPYHRPDANGGAEAFEALHLATINVVSVGMAATGAAMFAFGVDGVQDMRGYMRRGMGIEDAHGNPIVPKSGGGDEEIERDIEEWVGSVLGQKYGDALKKERDGEGVGEGKAA
ncbi:hypothetical protein P168DRAFT_300712 [Aspergillus campestris IBT 28561]|uniref:Altered inheritance of mitochondria protein 11 n=1 Tax=Aspergillus campestris (strain IBT 28561) TaxID=1392248 RepID=A0A2I1DDH4_ASPC2|nr:uncharacterized protein P168DRAFT_300712 [Aspergillus campestris IBT 28561]PKY07915.1 hypothetical protein P168DRAFT_300712 [Aspergillus campestris IBT 28561]